MPYTPGQFPALYSTRPGAPVTTPTNTQPTPGSSPTPAPVRPMTPPAASAPPQAQAPAAPLPSANPEPAAPQQAPVDPVGVKPAPVRQNNWFDNIMENPWVQGAALGASFIPVVGTGINVAFQGVDMARNLANGDKGKALANAAYMIPGVGAAAKATKGAVMGARAAKGLSAAGKATAAWKGAQAASKATQAARAAQTAVPAVQRGLAARTAIRAGVGAAKLAPGVAVDMYGQNHHNATQQQQTLVDEYNQKVQDYTSQSPLHQLHYERSQANPQTFSQAGSLQPWGSQ